MRCSNVTQKGRGQFIKKYIFRCEEGRLAQMPRFGFHWSRRLGSVLTAQMTSEVLSGSENL